LSEDQEKDQEETKSEESEEQSPAPQEAAEAEGSGEVEPAGAAEDGEAAPEDEEEPEEPVEYELLGSTPQKGCIVEYEVSIPWTVYAERTDELFKELRQSVTIEGFRRGKAPRKLLQIRFGKEITKDACQALAANVGKQIAEEQELALLGEPYLDVEEKKANDSNDQPAKSADEEVEVKADKGQDEAAEETDSKDEKKGKDTAEKKKVEEKKSITIEGEGNPVKLIIEMESEPKLTITGYQDGLEVEVERRDVTDEMVGQQLEQIREGTAQFVAAAESAVFNKGDGALIDYEALDQNGAPLAQMTRTDCFERDLAAAVPPQLAEQLSGLKAGTTIEADIESSHQTRRGEERKTTDKHRLTLKEIRIRELPNLDDEFAKDLGDFDSLDALKDRIRKDLETQAERANRDETLAKICDKLLEANEFDAPRSMVATATYQAIQNAEMRLARMGLGFQSLGEDAQERYLESTRAEAERNVKINLAVRAVAQAEKIDPDDSDVDRQLEQMANDEGRKPLAIRARLEREKRFDNLKAELAVDKVNDFLISKTKVTPVDPKPPKAQEDNAEETKEDPEKSE